MTVINRSALRRNTATSLLAKIKDSANKKGNSDREDRNKDYWQPTVDTNGNGFAVIRFMPAKNEESLPYIKEYSQGFKVGTKWFINLCPTTIGLPSPAVEHCNELWESGLESDKAIARERKRKLRYISNIQVIKDPKNPENDGKFFKFGYGQKIFEKLQAVMAPPEEFGEEPRDPFSFFDGCIVKLKVKKKDGYRNYDDTVVEAAPNDMCDGDEDKLMEVLEQIYDLDAEIAPEKFKPYQELKKELMRVIGEDYAADDSPVAEKHAEKANPSKSTSYKERAAKAEPAPEQESVDSNQSGEDDDDADLKLFQQLANQ